MGLGLSAERWKDLGRVLSTNDALPDIQAMVDAAFAPGEHRFRDGLVQDAADGDPPYEAFIRPIRDGNEVALDKGVGGFILPADPAIAISAILNAKERVRLNTLHAPRYALLKAMYDDGYNIHTDDAYIFADLPHLKVTTSPTGARIRDWAGLYNIREQWVRGLYDQMILPFRGAVVSTVLF